MVVTLPTDSTDNGSLRFLESSDARSRASSLISTSTRFTTNTTPRFRPARDDRQEFMMVDRPSSVFSVGSQSLPPYQQEDAEHRMHMMNPTASGQSAASSPSPMEALEGANDAANALAFHYRGIIQTIDQNHLNEIHKLQTAHREEIGSLRHDIDQAYRREFRAIRQEMEKVREESASQVEKAQQEVARSAQLIAVHADYIKTLQDDMRRRDETHVEEQRQLQDRIEASYEREINLRKEYEAALIEASQKLRQVQSRPGNSDSKVIAGGPRVSMIQG